MLTVLDAIRSGWLDTVTSCAVCGARVMLWNTPNHLRHVHHWSQIEIEAWAQRITETPT